MLFDVIYNGFGIVAVLFLAWAFGNLARTIPLLSGLLLTILVIFLLELTWQITISLGHTKID